MTTCGTEEEAQAWRKNRAKRRKGERAKCMKTRPPLFGVCCNSSPVSILASPQPLASSPRSRVFQRLRNDLDQILDLGLFVEIFAFDRVVHHEHAERTADGDGLGIGCHQLVYPFVVNPRALFLFLPHRPAARAAAERAVLGLGDLVELQLRNSLERGARGLVALIVPAQIAGVVEGSALQVGLLGNNKVTPEQLIDI